MEIRSRNNGTVHQRVPRVADGGRLDIPASGVGERSRRARGVEGRGSYQPLVYDVPFRIQYRVRSDIPRRMVHEVSLDGKVGIRDGVCIARIPHGPGAYRISIHSSAVAQVSGNEESPLRIVVSDGLDEGVFLNGEVPVDFRGARDAVGWVSLVGLAEGDGCPGEDGDVRNVVRAREGGGS